MKKALPVLSFPAIQLMGITVNELISDSSLQAKGMKLIAERVEAAPSVSLMDLSLEAECFGSTIRYSDDEVPTVIGSIVSTEEEAEALKIPEIGAGRTTIYIEAIEKACKLITDRPVFAGIIGPFSLDGRLLDVTEFRNGTPESIREATLNVMNACCKYTNFVISSGCDIPPLSNGKT